jgi:hypothetical protein
MRPIHFRVFCLFTLALGYVAGCGGTSIPSPKTNDAVEGTLTLDNTPMGGVIITFLPQSDGETPAPSSSGTTDDDGHFKLSIDANRPGAVIGKHKVMLSRGRPADPAKGQKDVPSEFKDTRPVPAVYKPQPVATVRLEVAVTVDKHTGYDFSIKSTDK